ncbi:hypothetical protein M9Y10_034485 [Tritrichomonas musculus]|uniref:Uncharacterized protein n=1 Tax=Tritrichomonas musculus TaxID=1915356 RepID=A0ABR2KG28_9EUKA
MFEVSSSTILFGNLPQKKFINNEPDDYKNEISQRWTLEPNINQKVEEVEAQPKKIQRISNTGPKSHASILKGSTGSKLFSMLQNKAPSTRVPLNLPQVKSSEPDPPRRKLRSSS